MYFSKKLIGNSRSGKEQYGEVVAARNSFNLQEQMFVNQGLLLPNQGLIPRDVYQEFDNVTVDAHAFR